MKFNRIVIAQHERGVCIRNKQVVSILQPGVHWIWDARTSVDVVDSRNPEVIHEAVLALVDHQPALVERYFQVFELEEYDVGLVYERGALKRVLAPGARYVFWAHTVGLRVDIVNTRQQYRVNASVAAVIASRSDIAGASALVLCAEVASRQVGLLWVDGELVDTLSAGVHAFWRCNRSMKVEYLDLRLQTLEVSGQEILTKDKVSLRINLSANYQITDAAKARLALADPVDYLYRSLQFVLREAVGTRTLDALLADKDALNQEVFRTAQKRCAEYGILLDMVGLKDIILPGDMKDILNQVVAAEKAAQANVIRRREETAATRSLLNTAKLMDDHPTLLRLKELEALEKVTEKVDRITVYDGLDGLLRDTVKLQV